MVQIIGEYIEQNVTFWTMDNYKEIEAFNV